MLDPVFLAVAVPAVMIAGIAKGGFGGAGAFVATPILALAVEPAVALALMLPVLMMMDVAALRAFWGRWEVPPARALMIGAVPGVVLGAALYRVADPDVFRLLIGGMAVGFVAWQGARAAGLVRLRPAAFSAGKGVLAGSVSGFTSFVSHAGGPPVTIFLLPLGLDRTRYQGTTVLYFWVLNALKVVPYAALGFFTAATALGSLVLMPVALVGVWLGVHAHRVVSDRVFFALTYVLLVVTGLRLIWVALT